MDEQKQGPASRLESLLGYDSTRKNQGGKEVLAAALAEVKKERDEANQKKATELIKKAISIRDQMVDAEKQFNGHLKKFNKELGRVIGSIEQLGSGKPPTPESEESQAQA